MKRIKSLLLVMSVILIFGLALGCPTGGGGLPKVVVKTASKNGAKALTLTANSNSKTITPLAVGDAFVLSGIATIELVGSSADPNNAGNPSLMEFIPAGNAIDWNSILPSVSPPVVDTYPTITMSYDTTGGKVKYTPVGGATYELAIPYDTSLSDGAGGTGNFVQPIGGVPANGLGGNIFWGDATRAFAENGPGDYPATAAAGSYFPASIIEVKDGFTTTITLTWDLTNIIGTDDGGVTYRLNFSTDSTGVTPETAADFYSRMSISVAVVAQ